MKKICMRAPEEFMDMNDLEIESNKGSEDPPLFKPIRTVTDRYRYQTYQFTDSLTPTGANSIEEVNASMEQSIIQTPMGSTPKATTPVAVTAPETPMGPSGLNNVSKRIGVLGVCAILGFGIYSMCSD